VVGDFDRNVKRIASQPFQLKARVDGTLLRRVPDYLMVTDVGPLVVDVKRAEELLDPEVKITLELTRRVVEVRGWMYEVACEPEEVVYANIRFLAGYRREWLFDREVLDELRGVAQREPAQSVRTVLHDANFPGERQLPDLCICCGAKSSGRISLEDSAQRQRLSSTREGSCPRRCRYEIRVRLARESISWIATTGVRLDEARSRTRFVVPLGVS
jgi:hypothetical protein